MKIALMSRNHPKFGTFRGRIRCPRDFVEHRAFMRNLERWKQEYDILHPPKKKQKDKQQVDGVTAA